MTAKTDDPYVRFLLGRHPHVGSVEVGEGPLLRFEQGDWVREVRVADSSVENFGLMELMDNNPVVCADLVSVPSPAATLALIALGPLAWSGILAERPAFITNVEATEEDLDLSLRTVGWVDGVNLHVEPQDLDGVCVATAMAAIDTPEDIGDIEELFDERFSHSFYVRRSVEEEWEPSLVRGTARACYRVSVAPDRPQSLVTVRVMADLRGKCGAAQVVHAMNVMCGFEESLGID